MAIKLTKEEVAKTTKDPLALFRSGIKSKVTLTKYERKLKIFLCHTLEEHLIGNPSLREAQRKERLTAGNKNEIEDILDADFEDRVREFVDNTRRDPSWTEDILLAYSAKLKQRTELAEEDQEYLNPQSFSNYFKAQKKLFKMNGIHFVWDRINSTFPELDNDNETRGYEREEIQKILNFANPLEKAIVLIASSSGMRRGGFAFTWDCIVPIYRKNNDLIIGKFDDEDDSNLVCGMITVYKKSSEQYFAFFTPEAWKAIRIYKQKWLDDVTHNPKDKDPFMKKAGPFVDSLSPDAVANRLSKVLRRANIRDILTNGKRRHTVPVLNGFRRFFNKINKETLSKDSPLAALIKKEMMLSHTGLIKLDKNYFKTHWKELVEEYLQAVPSLTISNEERQKLTITRLRKEKSELEEKTERISNLENAVDELRMLAKRNQVISDSKK